MFKVSGLRLLVFYFTNNLNGNLKLYTLNFKLFFIMNKFSAYLRDSYKELVEKVSWPTWEQLQQSTMIVLGATLFITAMVAVMDFVANGSLKFIYSLF
jgi:preprotein translocase subunit SecE